MAFVYRNTKKTDSSRPKTPGPNAYKQQTKYDCSNKTVTFMDRTKREIWQQNPNPGPGQYLPEEQLNMKPDRVIYKGEFDDFLVIDDQVDNRIKGCYSSFKSKSKRLDTKIQQTPGPGSYEVSPTKFKNRKQNSFMKQSSQLTRYLFEQAKNETFNDAQEQMTTIAPNNDQKNESRIQASHLLKKSSNRGLSSFCSKVQRSVFVRPMTSIGPGSYNIQKCNKNDKKTSINRDKASFSMNQTKNEHQATVGPGSYNPDNSNCYKKQMSQSKGIQCFGSLQSRFGNRIKTAKSPNFEKINHPLSGNKQKSDEFKKNVPFMSETSKQYNNFLSSSKGSNLNRNISPVSYNIHNNMSDKIFKKNESKLNCVIFGTGTKIQSKVKNDVELSHNQQLYLGVKHEKNKQKKPASACHRREKKITRKESQKQNPKYMQNNIDQRPLCYDNATKTFTKDYSQKQQKQAPFMMMSERFKQKNFNYSEQVLKSIEEQEKFVDMSVGTKKYKGQMKSNNMIKTFLSRARQQQSDQILNKKQQRVLGPTKQNFDKISPQSYNPVYPKNKTSYNVLFQSCNKSQRVTDTVV